MLLQFLQATVVSVAISIGLDAVAAAVVPDGFIAVVADFHSIAFAAAALLVDGVAAAAAVTAISPSWQISPRSGRHPDQSAATTETTISSDINPGAYISKQLF
jgi:hypothetical protein